MRNQIQGRFRRGGRVPVRFGRPFRSVLSNGWGPRPSARPCGPRPSFGPCPPFLRMGPANAGRYSSPAFPDGVPMRPPHPPPLQEPHFIRLIPPSYPGRGQKRPNSQVFIQETPVDDITAGCEPLEDATDEELAVLAELFQPLYCQLCQLHLNSPQQAATHYIGKNHKRNIGSFLAKRRGFHPPPPPPPQFQPCPSNSVLDETYCSLCDVVLTSSVQANDHYSGRNHNQRANGHMAMTKRVFKTRSEQFKKRPKEPQAPPPPKKPPVQPSTCTICNVQMTSESQVAIHEAGAKHKKNMEKKIASGANPLAMETVVEMTPTPIPIMVDFTDDNCIIGPLNNEVWFEPPSSKVPRFVSATGDLSMFRTPSGTYYCPSCDATVNSESQFSQHLESKRHKKQGATASTKK